MRLSALTVGEVAVLLCFLASASQAVSQQQQPPVTTLRTTVRIVYVDIVVRDRGGQVVRGLKQDAFKLTEEGKPQKISLFEEHNSAAPKPPTSPPSTAGLFSNVPPDAADKSLNIVLFDLMNTAPLDQPYARQRMIGFLRALPPGKQVALFVLSDRLHMIQGFTFDSDTLVRAAQSIDLKQLNRIRGATQKTSDVDTGAYVDSQATIARVGQQLAGAIVTEDLQNTKVRLFSIAEAFTELSHAVGGYPGRKNLFWLAGEFSSSTSNSLLSLAAHQISPLGTTATGITPPVALLATSVNPGSSPLNEQADRAVADSGMAIYPISVVGVETDSIASDQSGLGTAGSHTGDTMSRQFHDRQEVRSVMNNIAAETGGEAFYGNNDPGALLRRGFEDSENYYTIAYQPTNHDWNGSYRKLNVSTTPRSGSLSYRRGYYALPELPPKNAEQEFQTAMRIDTPPSTMLSLRASLKINGRSAPATEVDARIDVRGIGFTTDAEGNRHARLEVGLMAYPIGVDDARPTQSSGTLNLNLNPQQYSSLLESGVFVHPQLPLKAGKYVLRMGVLDTGSGRIGTLNMPLQMPSS